MRVGVVSPFCLTRESLSCLLSTDRSLQVIKLETLNGNYDIVHKMGLSVLLMETSGRFDDGRAILQLRELAPQTKVLMLVDEIGEETEYQALRFGARGCVARSATPATLFKALRAVAQGELWVTHRVATRVLDERVTPRKVDQDRSRELTGREFRILGLLAEGYTNKEIAGRLCVAENTIKSHLQTIFHKLTVRTRLDASLYYFRHSAQIGYDMKSDHTLSSPAGVPATDPEFGGKRDQE